VSCLQAEGLEDLDFSPRTHFGHHFPRMTGIVLNIRRAIHLRTKSFRVFTAIFSESKHFASVSQNILLPMKQQAPSLSFALARDPSLGKLGTTQKGSTFQTSGTMRMSCGGFSGSTPGANTVTAMKLLSGGAPGLDCLALTHDRPVRTKAQTLSLACAQVMDS
jgi:hypothetical protein